MNSSPELPWDFSLFLTCLEPKLRQVYIPILSLCGLSFVSLLWWLKLSTLETQLYCVCVTAHIEKGSPIRPHTLVLNSIFCFSQIWSLKEHARPSRINKKPRANTGFNTGSALWLCLSPNFLPQINSYTFLTAQTCSIFFCFYLTNLYQKRVL